MSHGHAASKVCTMAQQAGSDKLQYRRRVCNDGVKQATTNLLQGNYDIFHFTAEDVRKRDDSTATIDDLIAELAEEANKALWCIVETTQAPDHAHTAQNQGQNLGNVLQERQVKVLTYTIVGRMKVTIYAKSLFKCARCNWQSVLAVLHMHESL